MPSEPITPEADPAGGPAPAGTAESASPILPSIEAPTLTKAELAELLFHLQAFSPFFLAQLSFPVQLGQPLFQATASALEYA